MNKYHISRLVIEGFVYSILHNIHPQPLARKEIQEESFSRSMPMEESPSLDIPEPEVEPEIEMPEPIISSGPPGMTPSIMRPEDSLENTGTRMPTPEIVVKSIHVPKPAPAFTPSIPRSSEININQEQQGSVSADPISKISVFLSDPRVESIECQGPGKNILVRKDGLIQKTKTALSKEDVSGILEYYSERTRIPVIGGTFRVAYNNLIVTAVVSESVGTRFVINKRRQINH